MSHRWPMRPPAVVPKWPIAAPRMVPRNREAQTIGAWLGSQIEFALRGWFGFMRRAA